MAATDASEPADDWRQRAAQVMPTEHFTLQSARAATIADASGRANLYLASVSAALVAVAFIGQASAMGTAFSVFSLVLFPTLFFLGLATFARVCESGAEDIVYARGINRIRHFYLEYVPEAAPYFILSAHDDMAGVMSNMAVRPSRLQIFLTTAGMIGVINSVVAGVAVGLAVDLLDRSLLVDLVAGAVAFGLSAVLHWRAAGTFYVPTPDHAEVRFPSPSCDPGDGGDDRQTTGAARA